MTKRPRKGKTGGGRKPPSPPPSLPTGSTRRQERIRQAVEDSADTKTGRVDPKILWRAARNPEHPLHSEFDWDVKRAAEQHWTDTARKLIREVRFSVVFEDRKIVAPYYISDPRTPGKYSQTVRVATKVDIATRVLRDEVDRIEGSIARARALALNFELIAEFESMLAIALKIKSLLDDDFDGDDDRPRPEARPQ